MKITKILHTDTTEKMRFLRLIDLLSVWERGGTFRNIVKAELNHFDEFGKHITPFNIVTAHNDAGALVGYCFYYPKSKSIEIYVLPHLRRTGIGSTLIEGVREWSGISALSGYTGFAGWAEFFEANFIINLEGFDSVSLADADKYGSVFKARSALRATAKRQMSKAYQTSLKADKVV